MVASILMAPLLLALVSGSFGTTPVFSDGDGVTLTRRDPGSALEGGARDVGVVYDAMSQAGENFVHTFDGFFGGAIADDYTSIISAASTLQEFEFFGGVGTGGHVVFIDFFSADFTQVGGFGLVLPTAGNFVWTITMGDPTSIPVPAAGIVVMSGDDGFSNPDGQPTIGSWLVTDSAPAIGTTNDAAYRMKISVIPSSGGVALIGIAGLAASRRRRRC